jgi:IclR family transcriptional regulator, acetate operon repressor
VSGRGQPASVPYPIESVDNVLRLLQLLHAHEELGVTVAARLLGVAPSTAHRLFAMLVFRGFAVQNARRRYEPVPDHLHPTRTEPALSEQVAVLRPLLTKVMLDVDETVHFVVLRGTAAFFADGVEADHPMRVVSRAGLTMPAHCTAAGKAMLGQLSPADVDALYPHGLPDVYGPAATDMPTLKRQLASVRRAGFAVSREENERSVVGAAVCLRGDAGRMRGALAIGVASGRCPNTRLAELAHRLLDAAGAAQPLLSGLDTAAR